MGNRVYLDNNATTKPDDRVVEAMMPYLTSEYGNPSSVHHLGVNAEKAVNKQRRLIADCLGVNRDEIYFTSGATEANNLIINNLAINERNPAHIVTTAVEHASVRDVIGQWEQEGTVVTRISPTEEGVIRAEDVINAVREDTFLVSIMHVNNETGAIFPVEQAARKIKSAPHAPFIHVDGVQAFGKYPVELSHIDAYTISGHKIHGPKGIGALYLDSNQHLIPFLRGGGQERGLRSGTENVPGIVGLGKAAELMYEERATSLERIDKIRETLLKGLEDVSDVYINSPLDYSLPTTLNASFPPVPGEVMVNALSEEEIYISSGSACASRKGSDSHVLRAMGFEGKYIRSSVRFSFSRMNSVDEAVQVVETLKRLLPRLRKVAELRH